MSIITSPLLLGADGVTQYQISRSLRFNSADSAYLNRTPASSSNRKTWTWAGWVKRSALSGSRQAIFACTDGGASFYTGLEFDASERITVYDSATSGAIARVTTAVFRDISSWYHILLSVDTTSATADNRVRLFVNGSEITVFTTKANPTQNADTYVNAAVAHSTGSWAPAAGLFFNGYLADVHFIDGQALTPSSFTETDATTGQLIPKAYSGSYGSNGWKLSFSDNSTVAALGTDTSSNGNTWTVNNFSVGPGGNTSQNWSATASIAGQAGFEATKAFDGDASSASSTYYFPGTNGTGTFTFAQSVPYSTVKIWYGRNNGRLFVNGVDMAIASTGYAEIDQAYLASKGVTSPLVSIGLERTGAGNGAYLFGVQVNGSQLIDPVYNAGNDSLVDTPTSYGTDTGVGGEVRGNYCTWNPLHYRSETLSNGNLDYSAPVIAGVVRGTIPMPSTGKWYWEVTPGNTRVMLGIERTNSPVNGGYPGSTADSYAYAGADGQLWYNSSSSTYGNTFGSGDVIGVAFDADNGKLFFSKNNTWQASGNPLTGSNPAVSGLIGSWIPSIGRYDGSPTASSNFGQRAFSYTAPSGFKALCDTNLPTPVVAKGSTAMDVKLYTGNGGTQTISGLGFGPDFVWLKRRDAARNHALYDIVRGVKKYLASDSGSAEYEPASGGVSSFDASSFTVVEQGGVAVNESSASMVAWTWDAGSSTVTNTAGSISSQVRANASAGFSVVTVNSTTIGTIGHGLGVKPAMIIEKCRGTTSNWYVRHQSLGDMKSSYLTLNTTAAGGPPGDTTAWNNTEPTSTTISINNNYLYANGSVVYYCFAPVAGYSSFGSYTGNGSADGPFVYTGFRPRWVMVKCSSLSGPSSNWVIHDTSRDASNVMNKILLPNLSNAELTDTDYQIDTLSNGFKIRNGNGNWNASSATYVYACFAESPFQYARAR